MRDAAVYVHGQFAGELLEKEMAKDYVFTYDSNYQGAPVSLTMPIDRREYHYNEFPPFFEGLLPEGDMLKGLLHQHKIDSNDLFSQLLAIGHDTVGSVTVIGKIK